MELYKFFDENCKALLLAKEFFAKKERKAVCELTAYCDDDQQEYVHFQEFSEEELAALRVLRDKYGNEELVKHLDEVFEDPDELHDLSCGDEITSLDIDTPYYQYLFSRHELQDGKLNEYKMKIELSDKMYIYLLALCLDDPSINMNKLEHVDKGTYSIIMHQVDAYLSDDGFFVGRYPYLVTMDELKSDAQKVFETNPEFLRNPQAIRGYPF